MPTAIHQLRRCLETGLRWEKITPPVRYDACPLKHGTPLVYAASRCVPCLLDGALFLPATNEQPACAGPESRHCRNDRRGAATEDAPVVRVFQKIGLHHCPLGPIRIIQSYRMTYISKIQSAVRMGQRAGRTTSRPDRRTFSIIYARIDWAPNSQQYFVVARRRHRNITAGTN